MRIQVHGRTQAAVLVPLYLDARDARQAIDLVTGGEFDVAFLLRPTPVEQVGEIAAAGQSMPPKSTYFFPKVPTGLLFNPLV